MLVHKAVQLLPQRYLQVLFQNFSNCIFLYQVVLARRQRSWSETATRLHVNHTRRRLRTVLCNAERQAGKLLVNTNFIVFGLIRPGIKPENTFSVADAHSLLGWLQVTGRSCKMITNTVS